MKSFITFCSILLVFYNSAEPQQKTANAVPAGTKKICITFDNLPAERTYDKSERYQINNQILSTLKNYDVTAAGFVIGDNIDDDWEILINWLEAGHTIGFMTYSGQDIENVPTQMFVSDISKGKETIREILGSYQQGGQYFRFPFLHYGDSPDIREKVEEYLVEQEIEVAHATVVVEDFVYNLSLEKIITTTDTNKIAQVREEYMEHLLEKLAQAETLAMEIVNRPIRQILQLRANRINALFLDEIINLLDEKGYQFISIESAVKDKVYNIYDSYYENRTVSFLERLRK